MRAQGLGLEFLWFRDWELVFAVLGRKAALIGLQGPAHRCQNLGGVDASAHQVHIAPA